MSERAPLRLRRWIWRAFLKSALLPLVLVEIVLIGIYLLSNDSIRDTQVGYLRETAVTELQTALRSESHLMQQQLEQVAQATLVYRNLTARALVDQARQPEPLAISHEGVRYSANDSGGAASFYSAHTPLAQQDLDKVARLASLDPLMGELVARLPLVTSAYFNSWDSYNRIYPWFRTDEQYPPDMQIPTFNFYYLADATHNPTRGQVWTDVYLDPAGHGWMMSSVAPVYRDDFLEGVVGLDVTVSGILEHFDQLQLPWNGYALLVGSNLDIMALAPRGEDDFGLRELTEHSYAQAIQREVLKPDDFNLARREPALVAAMREVDSGSLALPLAGRNRLVAWQRIDKTGWQLLAVVDEDHVFAQTDALASRYQHIGYLLIAGLILFYLVYFAVLWRRAQRLSEELRRPITGISRMMSAIGQGHWRPRPVSSPIIELSQMAALTARVGEQLEQSEARRQTAQRRLELVMESASEGLWELDLQREQLYLSGRICALFRLPEALPLATFVGHLHPPDQDLFAAALEQARGDTHGHFEAELRLLDERGQHHWLLVRGRALEFDERQRALVLAGTLVDIQRIKAVEEALRQASEYAQAASQAKSRFISSMSHELRTPLNAIQGFAQLLEMEKREGHSNAMHLNEILSASRHLSHLVEDILDWSSAQSAPAPQPSAPIDLLPIVYECTEMVALDIRRNGLQLKIEMPREPLLARADGRRLRQVLLNLLSNAIKYNRPGGTVSLGWQRIDDRLRLIVADTGRGIDSASQALLFEPFQRLGLENSAIQGTGIGLALCREYALAMGGSMGLESEWQKGSRFWIELPAAPDRNPVIRHTGRARVFYAESDAANQVRVRETLADLADVEVCGDGQQALMRLLADPPSLLLLDLQLPGLEAAVLLDALRHDGATRQLPVVVLTSSDPEQLTRAAALNCQGLLGKPLDREQLRGLVAALLVEESRHA